MKERKKVLLIDPAWKTGKFEAPSFSLGYLAATLLQNNIDIKIIDFVLPEAEKAQTLREFENIYEASFLNDIKEKVEDMDLVGITCNYGSYPRALKIADTAKKANPDADADEGNWIAPELVAGYEFFLAPAFSVGGKLNFSYLIGGGDSAQSKDMSGFDMGLGLGATVYF